MRICVIGVGRVGLTFAVTAAAAGMDVTGVDRDPDIVRKLHEGRPHFYEAGLEGRLQAHLGRNLHITTFPPAEAQDAWVVCVPTPVSKPDGKVQLQSAGRAITEVAEHLTDGTLVVLRSTVPIGTTRNYLLPMLAATGRRFHFAFCPERTAEGQALAEILDGPQIIGGVDAASAEAAVALFSQITATTIRVPTPEAAELIKLVDNTYRDLSFAFANEIALLSDRMGLDGGELIRLANLGYPRNNIPRPGPVGGTCLSKDPYILTEAAANLGYDFRLALQARAVNESVPVHLGQMLSERLARVGKTPAESKILIAGIAFKGRPETDDVRDSPALALAEYLRSRLGVTTIYAHDFVVQAEELSREGLVPCSLEDGFRDADAAILMNNHLGYARANATALAALMRQPAVILDSWHLFDAREMEQSEGVVYGGLGVG